MKSFWKCDVCLRFELDIEADNQDEAAREALRQGAELVLSGDAPLNRLTINVNAENAPVRVIDLSDTLLLFQAPKNHRLGKEVVELILAELQFLPLRESIESWDGAGCPTLLVRVPWHDERRPEVGKAFLQRLSDKLETYWSEHRRLDEGV